MRRTLLGLPAVLLSCALLTIVATPDLSAGATCEQWAGKLVSLQGAVDAKVAGKTQWQPARLNDTYCPGDMLRTGRRSRAEVALRNHPLLRLDENSTITFAGMKNEQTSLIDMLSGAALFFSRVTRNLEVRTATVNAGVEGTEFFLRVEEGKTSLSIYEGKVLATNETGSLAVTTGMSAVAEKGKAPVPAVVVRPRDAVRWALYYPPVLYARPSDFADGSDAALGDMMRRSVESYWKGDLAGAFAAIEGAPEETADPRFAAYRASLLLTVGRVDEAGADIGQALRLDPKNSNAIALQSVIAVVRNDRENALELAQNAVDADPKSPTARIALSYAQQSGFDLQGALDSTKEAVKLGPENALAWARLAELRQSFGELDASLEAAKKAAALSPDLSRTQTVLGFADLTRGNTQEAAAAFEKAIGLDPADPLPRLGLGLAKIRKGNLEEGRRELEVAIALDPDNGIFRSYLGKAYFEEKRDKLASGQYEMAKALDPMDPTPYFYDAIRKQTVNSPVEALRDLQKAIDRNDNRAVYRSRLLLDQDLAARSAGLARIYGDLGFQELALVEGWKSVNTDPGNYSAHRFLADSYSSLPRHEIARVSELLQSQLLQPLNITPIQPHLAESNLFVLEGAGPAGASFNEYNPLFFRNRPALQASGIVGENGTAGEEITGSWLHDRTSVSVGQYHFESDGFRTNADIRDDIVNPYLQVRLSPKTGIQAEYRYRETRKGDLALRSIPDDFSPNRRFEDETQMVRVGLHHAFSPGTDLIGSLMYQEGDFSDHDLPNPVITLANADTDQKGVVGELQMLFRLGRARTIAGVGQAKLDGDTVIRTEFFGVPDPPSISSRDVRHTNLYWYSQIDLLRHFILTVGASADFYDERDYLDEQKFNPKVGVLWNPFPGTTVRAAAFRAVKRTLLTNQTIEPTQVAGFNQFFDDDNATESKRVGVAVDQKLREGLYAGAEYSKRDLKVPFSNPVFDPVTFALTFEAAKTDWKEREGRIYLYWTPHDWVSLGAEYFHERMERGKIYNLGLHEVKTHRVPLRAGFFHPSGCTVTLGATYFDQDGSFFPQALFPQPMDPITFEPIALSGEDRFWLVDAAIGYRLPKRYGFVTVGAKNLFDRSFRYYDTDPFNPAIQPGRTFLARISLSF